MNDNPTTLQEAIIYFSDLDRCEEYMRQIRWQDRVPVCARCGSKKIGEIATRRLLKCRECKKQFSSRVGTVFESSKITLDKWFVATWMIANCKNGVSSCELSRAIGVPQNTAWFMLHRLRAAMDLTGCNVEADTTYIGGKAVNMHAARRAGIIRGRGTVGKAIVQAIVRRGGEARADVVTADDAVRLLPAVRRHVIGGEIVYTDAAPAYSELAAV